MVVKIIITIVINTSIMNNNSNNLTININEYNVIKVNNAYYVINHIFGLV